jgi:hypothetical protein
MHLHLRLTCDRDVADWEYSAIFDYYDTERFADMTDEIYEIDDYYNPAWEFVLPYSDEPAEVEEQVIKMLNLHHAELNDVYGVIADKESEYENEDE